MRLLKQVEKANKTRICDETKYVIDWYKANREFEKNNTSDVSKWKPLVDNVAYLRPLRHKDDKAMPAKQAELESKEDTACLWERSPLSFQFMAYKWEFKKEQENSQQRGEYKFKRRGKIKQQLHNFEWGFN